MVSLTALWLPILVSTVGIFVASSIVWMATPIHKNDYKRLGDKEGAVLEAVRSWGLAGGGMFMFPCMDPAEVKDNPQAAERLKTGPWGTMTVMAKPPNMGRSLGMWVVNLLVVNLLVAYVAGSGLHAGDGFFSVFRMVMTIAFLAYGGNALTDSIWRGRPWSCAPGAVLDGLIYASVAGLSFGLLWPGK